MANQGKIIQISVDQLELDLSNPRHKPVERPAEAIEFLVSKEHVVELAEDIAREGTNPMDLMGVVRRNGDAGTPTYYSVEGNRRVCALQLLHDPEKIPVSVAGRTKLINKLEAASKKADLSAKINVVLFSSKKAAKPWIDRMHINDGRSRRRWSPDQQERATGGGRNRDAAAFLDAALKRDMITEDERSAKLTTVQRYIGNPTMRKALGIYRDKDRKYWVNREIQDFSVLVEAFLDDIRRNKLSSRSDAADVIRYSDDLLERVGVGDDRTEKVSLADAFDAVISSRAALEEGGQGDDPDLDEPEEEPTEPDDDDQEPNEPIRPRTKLNGSNELQTAFASSDYQKLQSLYRSVTTLDLRQHCPLITVGFWSLMESLAALHGEGGTAFCHYFNNNRLSSEFGFNNKDKRKDLLAALKRLTEGGNSTKHSSIAGNFYEQQLANDFDVIAPLILRVLRSLGKEGKA